MLKLGPSDNETTASGTARYKRTEKGFKIDLSIRDEEQTETLNVEGRSVVGATRKIAAVLDGLNLKRSRTGAPPIGVVMVEVDFDTTGIVENKESVPKMVEAHRDATYRLREAEYSQHHAWSRLVTTLDKQGWSLRDIAALASSPITAVASALEDPEESQEAWDLNMEAADEDCQRAPYALDNNTVRSERLFFSAPDDTGKMELIGMGAISEMVRRGRPRQDRED